MSVCMHACMYIYIYIFAQCAAPYTVHPQTCFVKQFEISLSAEASESASVLYQTFEKGEEVKRLRAKHQKHLLAIV